MTFSLLKFGTYFIVFLLFALSNLSANNTYTVFGQITNKESGKYIPGATIKVVNSKKGSYSSTRGKFRLPFLIGKQKLKITSLGYKTKYLDVDVNNDTLNIQLIPSPILLNAATVVGDIDANQIIKRAIERKKENLEKLKTFSGLLYSKIVMELDGSAFAGADGGSITIGTTLGEAAPDKFKMFVMETFSNNYKDFEKNVRHTNIIQRRQTSNMTPNSNLFAMGEFINLYDDEVDMMNAKLVTPLSVEALDYYNFSLLERSVLDERYIYIIKVEPKSDLYPLFEGTINIVEGSYNLIAADLKPSSATAIVFIDSIHIQQKFEEIEENIWHPAFLELSGKAEVEVIKGFLDISVDVKASSIYSEMIVNKKLPDSIYYDNTKSLTVALLADSVDLSYWEKNSLRDITEKEKLIYARVDSLVQISDSLEEETFSSYNFNYKTPFFDFNRVGAISLGLSPSLYFKGFKIGADAAFSFGLQKPIGAFEMEYSLPIKFLTESDRLKVSAKIFSEISVISLSEDYLRIFNSLIAGFSHQDYYDYFEQEGWSAGFSFRSVMLNASVNFQESRHFSLTTNTNRSIFENEKWRENPKIEDGGYRTISTDISMPIHRLITVGKWVEITADINYILGRSLNDGYDFYRYNSSLLLKFPIIKTGYKPITMDILFEYGNSSENLPMQYQTIMKTKLLFISKFVSFISAANSEYAGRNNFITHFKLNLADIAWRWIGLPLYEGRGLDLILRGSTGVFRNSSYYKETGRIPYSELGFGFEKIPTFMSNVVYWGAGVAWGIGPVAAGNFGWDLTLVLPF